MPSIGIKLTTPQWSLVGAPAEQSTFGREEAVLRLTLFDSWTAHAWERDGFDYLDVAFDHERRPDLPQCYGGLSGSGLWQIQITRSANGLLSLTGSLNLEGVAFFQKPISAQQDIVRCHGRVSVYLHLLQGVAEQPLQLAATEKHG
jgi:hypothetical protein